MPEFPEISPTPDIYRFYLFIKMCYGLINENTRAGQLSVIPMIVFTQWENEL